MSNRRLPAALATAVAVLVLGGLPGIAAGKDAGEHTPLPAPPAFADRALRAYFGEAGSDDARGPFHERMSAVLAAPDGGTKEQARAWDIGEGRVLQAGCRQDGCAEKGAVVYDSATQSALVAGVLRMGCGDAEPAPAGCAPTSTLTVFMSATRPAPFQALAAIDSWADARAPGAARELRTLP